MPPEAFSRPVPLQDVTSAVVYGLQREVVGVAIGEQDEARRGALREWLATLSALLPAEPNRQQMGRLEAMCAHERAISPERWEELLGEIEAPLLPTGGPAGGIAWAACRGASADARGYPCGLWLLFHTLLAQARTDAQGVAALRAIRSYVRFFFGCQGCARHFLAMSNLEADPLDGVRTASGARLWLWRAHNRLNARLNASAASEVLRLGLPKQQWPTPAACPQCRPRYTAGGRRWELGAVAEYLHGTFCRPEPGRPCSSPGTVESAAGSSAVIGIAPYLTAPNLTATDAYYLTAGAVLAACLLACYHCWERASAPAPHAQQRRRQQTNRLLPPSPRSCGRGILWHDSDGSSD